LYSTENGKCEGVYKTEDKATSVWSNSGSGSIELVPQASNCSSLGMAADYRKEDEHSDTWDIGMVPEDVDMLETF
jgi:hypothetical protein